MSKEQNVQNKKKKRNKNRLFLLLLLLLFTGIMGGTATYAWFTANTTVTVDTLNVEVSTTGGISISATATDDWSVKINTDDINNANDGSASALYANATNQMPTMLEPVSTTADSLTGGKLNMFYGHVETDDDGTYILTSTDVTDLENTTTTESGSRTGKFLAFDMFLRLDNTVKMDAKSSASATANDAAQIYLKSGNVTLHTVTDSDGKKVIDSPTKGIQNAVRVAFVYENEDDNKETYANLQKLTAGDKTDNKNIYLWEPNRSSHTDSAISQASLTYGNTNVTNSADGAALSYYGLKSAFAKTDGITLQQTGGDFYTTHSDQFGPVTPYFTSTETTQADNLNQPLFTIKPGNVAKIKVYVWVEGQDVDCENDASGGKVDVNMSFGIIEQKS